MEFMSLKTYVEQQDTLNKVAKLIQEYYSKKKELTAEDLLYILLHNPEHYNNLQDLIPHYELQIMAEPDINSEIVECYTFYSYEAVQQQYEDYTQHGEYARVISVTEESIPDGKVDINNFEKQKEFWKRISFHDLRRLYVEIKSRYNSLDDLAKRLQENYNDAKPFEQTEEDRLDICAILNLFDDISK